MSAFQHSSVNVPWQSEVSLVLQSYARGPFQSYIRIIAPDRPGIGRSDYKSKSIVYWPQDIQELLDHLQIHKAFLYALSGSAPYALASRWGAGVTQNDLAGF